CEGDFSTVFVYDGATVKPAAVHNASGTGTDALGPVFGGPPTLDTVSGRAILTGQIEHRPDAKRADDVPGTVAMARAWPFGAIVSVPLLRESQAIGTINVAKTSVAPFSDNEIALLKTFADQAVIALENVRLFNETKEALDQQTATAEILRVISG